MLNNADCRGPEQAFSHLDRMYSLSPHKALPGNLLFHPPSNCHLLLCCGNKDVPVGREAQETLGDSHGMDSVLVFVIESL